MVDLIDIAIYGFISIFTVCLASIIGFMIVGAHFTPIMQNLTENMSTPIDLTDKFENGTNNLYIALGILIAIPFIVIILKYFHEKEHYAY